MSDFNSFIFKYVTYLITVCNLQVKHLSLRCGSEGKTRTKC